MSGPQRSRKRRAIGSQIIPAVLIAAIMAVGILAVNEKTDLFHAGAQEKANDTVGIRGEPIGAAPKQEALLAGMIVDKLEGGTLSLQDLRGRYVLIDFWAVWCKICEAQLPQLKKVWEEFGPRGDFVLLGLCLGEDRDAISRFIARHQELWPQGVLTEGFSDPVAEQYGVTSLPRIVLIGPDGRIVADNLVDDQIVAAVRDALQSARP